MGRGKRGRRGCLTTGIGMIILCIGVMAALMVFQKSNDADKIVDMIAGKMHGQQIPYQLVEGEESSLEGKYYYQQLSEDEKGIYQEILQGIKDNVQQIYVHSGDAQQTNRLFQWVLKDFPEIFWCDGTATSTAYDVREPYTVVEPLYLYQGEEKEEKKAQIEEEAMQWLSGISAEASDYDKILYVYEYIVNAVDYDMQADDNQNIYSVFINRRSVCAGYSKAMQYLLEKLEVFCTYVTGTTEGNQAHAWNLVLCEGDYYYVDVTWGDPVFQALEGEEEQSNISYDYMCCNDAELFRTHTPDADVTFPVCEKMDYNYYVVNGMYYTTYDSGETLKLMNGVIAAGSNPVVLKYSDSQVYAQAREDIFDNLIRRAAENLAQWYGLSEVKYSYIDDDRLNKITIFWRYQ